MPTPSESIKPLLRTTNGIPITDARSLANCFLPSLGFSLDFFVYGN